MKRQKKSFSFLPEELGCIKQRMLHWANQCNILLFLDNNQYNHTEGTYECLCGVDTISSIHEDDRELNHLKQSFQQDWLLGHISYDFKNTLEKLDSKHPDNIGFPEIHFFRPKIVCYILRGECNLWIETLSEDPEEVWLSIQQQEINTKTKGQQKIYFEKRIKEEEYIQIISSLKEHIKAGDCYEINFCKEAYSPNVPINPLDVFKRLNQISKSPFAAYYKVNEQHLMCTSPERFLRKLDQVITAQPIKGTASRHSDPDQDQAQKRSLQSSIKEQAENVMIVDLMRNDLARFCIPGTVEVSELFGIYSFPQVHQMISTIKGILRPELDFSDALRLAFPMGSMTGAPKIMVMQLIEHYEKTRRGIFSGCVGYISPEGDFDFNVVIRSLCYNQKKQYLNYQSGGAITFDSNPQQEWQETLLKAAALEKAVQQPLNNFDSLTTESK